MTRATAVLSGLVALLALGTQCLGDDQVSIVEGADGIPLATHQGRSFKLSFENYMERFAADDLQRPMTGGIVFTGSSSMVRWLSVEQDMAPMPVRNRAFGGSQSIHLWWYAERSVLPTQPRLIVTYIGDNDMPQQAVDIDNYMKYVGLFLEKVFARDPHTRIAFISNKPSPSRWHLWEKYQAGNAALAELCESDARLTYIDIVPTLLGEDGLPREECYLADRLHLQPEVYVSWTAVVRPVVERLWAEITAQDAATAP